MTDHDTVAAFIRTRFGNVIRGDLKHGDPLFSSGIIDSFGVLELIAFLEDTFRVVIDPSQHELTEFNTIDKIVDVVARSRAPGAR